MEASIIIPAYNSKGTILHTIRALQNQDFRGKFEIIVVDDGSNDGTAQMAQKEGAVVFVQKNAGPAKARNLGAKKSNGKILLFTDSDCTPEKNWLREMLSSFSDKKVIGVQGAYKTKQDSLVAKFVQAEIEERYDKMKRNSQNLDWVGSYSAAYRRDDFFDAGGFDESFPKASGEDPELSYKLAKMGKKLVFNPKAIVYHLHPETVTKYFWVKFYRAFYRINLYSKHKDKIVNDSYTTNSIKVQLISGYVGIGVTLLTPVLYFLGYELLAIIIFAINTLLGLFALGTMFWSLRFTPKNELGFALFSFLMIQVRNAAFMIGLPAGYIKHKVLK